MTRQSRPTTSSWRQGELLGCNSLGFRVLNSWFHHDVEHTTRWIYRRWHNAGTIDLALGRVVDWQFVVDTLRARNPCDGLVM